MFIDWTRPDPIVSASVRADPETLRAYNTHWRHHDAWVHSGHPLMRTEGAVVDGEVVLSDAKLRATDYYRGFLAPAGLARTLGINAIMQRGVMAAVACMYPPQAGSRTPALDPQRVAAAFGLTAAQGRVAAALVRADGVTELAQMLDIAPSTVHTHCKQIYRKLRVSGRAALVHALLEARPILAAVRRRDR